MIDQLLERLTIHVLHSNIRYAAHIARVNHVDDIGMSQLSADFRLALKAFLILRIFFILLAQNLERDRLVRFQVKRAIDNRHTAAADDIFYAETAADDFANQSCFHAAPSSPVQRISVTLSLPPASNAIASS